MKTYFPPGAFKYFCLSMFISMVAAAGRGCFLSQFDADDAYKQLQVRDEDLNQQVFFADGKFWVDFCASFGALYGNVVSRKKICQLYGAGARSYPRTTICLEVLKCGEKLS